MFVFIVYLNISFNYFLAFVMSGFVDSFRKKLASWQGFYDLVEPHLAPLPDPWDVKLSNFQKLLIIRVLRSDKVSYTRSILKNLVNESK